MATTTRVRIPVLMLLGIVFLASVSLSVSIAYWEGENPCHEKCVQSCNKENDAYRQKACQARCNLIQKNPDRECEDEEEWDTRQERQEHSRREPQRQRGRQEGEREEDEREREREHEREPWQPREPWRPRRHPQEREGEEEHHRQQRQREHSREGWHRGSQREREEDEEEHRRGRRHHHDPEEREGRQWDTREEREEHSRREPERQRGRQEGEKEEREREREPWQPRPHSQQREEEHRIQQLQRQHSREGRHWGSQREREEDEEEHRRGRRHHHDPEEREGRRWEEEEEEEEWRGQRRHDDPEERERVREREERQERHERERERESRREREERQRRREKRQQREERGEGREEEEEGGSGSESRRRNNPFLFRSNSNRFRTLFKNEHGSVRLLQRFDKRFKHRFQHLGKVRFAEVRLKPNTLLIPHHTDADFILTILSGRALVTLVNPNDKDSYNLERGDAIKIPAGTTFYVINPDDNQNLRAVKLAISVNGIGQIKDFNPSNSEYQESYFRGFSRSLLESTFNTDFEEIQRTLLGEGEHQQERRGRQSQEEGFIVKVSKEQISELGKHAKSSSKKGKSSEDEPFNVRSGDPMYSNNFGKFYEITPEKNQQLRDMNLFLSSVEINEGALLLPHYNSRAMSVVVVEDGKGEFQLAVPSLLDQEDEQEDQDQEEEDDDDDAESWEVRSYRGRLSQGDVVVVLAGHPVAFNASSDLRLFAFGVNALDNQRNFLAGEKDNVINQIQRQVKELTFPGSAEDVEKLIKNQRESHFVSARRQHQQKEEGKQGRKGPLSSILGAFY